MANNVIKLNRFALYTWGVLVFTMFVIGWGAFVRATGSGAGCGSHWPSCQGEVIPWAPTTETIIEFTHRLTSGLDFLLVLGLLIWAFRVCPKGHIVQTGAALSMAFMVLETLVGAALVLFELVAYNTSITRAWVVPVHLVNTFLLLTALTLTAWWASGGERLQFKGQGRWSWLVGAAYAGILILAASGGVTALGDTLFPVNSLAEGFRQDFSPSSHFLIRLRLYHPLIAVAVGAYIILVTGLFNIFHSLPFTKTVAKLFTVVYLAQLAVGLINVALLAPVWLQLVHLLISNILLIIFVLFVASAFRQSSAGALPVEIPRLPAQKKISGQPG